MSRELWRRELMFEADVFHVAALGCWDSIIKAGATHVTAERFWYQVSTAAAFIMNLRSVPSN